MPHTTHHTTVMPKRYHTLHLAAALLLSIIAQGIPLHPYDINHQRASNPLAAVKNDPVTYPSPAAVTAFK